MSFCSELKQRICQRAETAGYGREASQSRLDPLAFCCGMTFSHWGEQADKSRTRVMRAGPAEALRVLEETYENITKKPLPVTVKAAATLREYKITIPKKPGRPARRSSENSTAHFSQPFEQSRKEVLSVFGRFEESDGELKLAPSIRNDESKTAAFIAGVFVANGLIGDPERDYHLEITGLSAPQADELACLMMETGIHPAVTLRGGLYSLYLKDAGQISELLAAMGDSEAYFAVSNVMIKKDVGNRMNRQLNCDAANFAKSAAAARRQIEDIELITASGAAQDLPPQLAATAKARTDNPDASLSELAEILKIGRSGVNHRLAKIGDIAERLRALAKEDAK